MASTKEIHDILDGVELTMRYKRDEGDWYYGYCEEVPEARTQGETLEEFKENLADAVVFMLEEYTTEELQQLKESVEAAERDLLVL